MSRQILSNAAYARNQLSEILQAIFAAELLCPSRELWLVSPWISDIPVLDNRDLAFTSLLPNVPAGQVQLSTALSALSNKGSTIVIVTHEGKDSDTFLDALERRVALSGDPGALRVRFRDELHAKGLVGDDFQLVGSMNFTLGGLTRNDELVTFKKDPREAEELRRLFQNEYGNA